MYNIHTIMNMYNIPYVNRTNICLYMYHVCVWGGVHLGSRLAEEAEEVGGEAAVAAAGVEARDVEGRGPARVAGPAGAADAVHVGVGAVGGGRQVEVDHVRHLGASKPSA